MTGRSRSSIVRVFSGYCLKLPPATSETGVQPLGVSNLPETDAGGHSLAIVSLSRGSHGAKPSGNDIARVTEEDNGGRSIDPECR